MTAWFHYIPLPVQERARTLRPKHFLCLLLQFWLKVRVSDANQRLSALTLGFALQSDNTKFRHDKVHVLPRRGEGASWLQHWYDARELPFPRRRRQDHN